MATRMLTVQFRDSDGVTRAYSTGEAADRKAVEALAFGMLDIYCGIKKMDASKFTKHEQEYDLAPEGHILT